MLRLLEATGGEKNINSVFLKETLLKLDKIIESMNESNHHLNTNSFGSTLSASSSFSISTTNRRRSSSMNPSSSPHVTSSFHMIKHYILVLPFLTHGTIELVDPPRNPIDYPKLDISASTNSNSNNKEGGGETSSIHITESVLLCELDAESSVVSGTDVSLNSQTTNSTTTNNGLLHGDENNVEKECSSSDNISIDTYEKGKDGQDVVNMISLSENEEIDGNKKKQSTTTTPSQMPRRLRLELIENRRNFIQSTLSRLCKKQILYTYRRKMNAIQWLKTFNNRSKASSELKSIIAYNAFEQMKIHRKMKRWLHEQYLLAGERKQARQLVQAASRQRTLRASVDYNALAVMQRQTRNTSKFHSIPYICIHVV